MSIKVGEGKLVPVLDALEDVLGARPSPATVWRWQTRGSNGARLATVKVGRRRLTTREAVIQFVEAANEPDAVGTSRQRDDKTTESLRRARLL